MSQSTENIRPTVKTANSLPDPKGWVRWSGLGVFLAIIGGIIAIGYLSFSLLLKNQIESFATDAWGAKVEIGSLDIGLFPIRVGVFDLEITDPDKPMENLIQVGKVGGSLNFYHLVVGRTVIEELNIEALSFNQARETSGEIVKREKSVSTDKKQDKNSLTFKVPSAAIPDLDSILAREKLKTFVVANKVQQQISELDSDWKRLEKEIPTEQDLIAYQKRFNQITKGSVRDLNDLQKRKQALETLQKEVKIKITNLRKSKDLFQQKLPALKKNVLALKELPAKDLARLKKQYGMNQQGLSNVTRLLYGDKIQAYVDQVQYWYNKAKPFIDEFKTSQENTKQIAEEKMKRDFGVDVVYREYDPQPDFIIKKIVLSSLIPWGDLALNVTDLNFDQVISKKPIRFIAQLQPNGQTGIMNIVGESNFIQPEMGFHLANITMNNYQIKDWSLSESEELPVIMKKGTNQVRGEIRLFENEKIKGTVNLIYQKVNFDLSKTNSKSVKRYISPIFSDIKQFTVSAGINGKLFSPKIDAKSDLDSKLSSAFKKALGKEIDQAKNKLTREFDRRVAKQLQPIDQQFSNLLGEQISVKKDYKKLQEILSKKPSQYVEQKKKELKKEAVRKANAKWEKEKKKQRKKLEDKFKKLF